MQERKSHPFRGHVLLYRCHEDDVLGSGAYISTGECVTHQHMFLQHLLKIASYFVQPVKLVSSLTLEISILLNRIDGKTDRPRPGRARWLAYNSH